MLRWFRTPDIMILCAIAAALWIFAAYVAFAT